MHVESELKEKIANKLYEIQNDQTGEIITKKFMFGGASNDVRYIFIMGKKPRHRKVLSRVYYCNSANYSFEESLDHGNYYRNNNGEERRN